MGLYRGLLQAVLDSKLYTVVAAFLLLILATRLLSGILGKSKITLKGNTVPTLPYWFPVLGHAPPFLLQRNSFFNWARQTHPKGAFALNLFGSTHNIIFRPSLGQTLMNQTNDVADGQTVKKYIMTAVFGWPKTESDVYDRAIDELHGLYGHLSTRPGLPTMIDKTLEELKKTINNLVTFSPNPVDQTWWERSSNVKPLILADGEQAEEVDLFTLVRDFSVLTSNLAVFGTDFQNNNPQVLEDLWQMDRGFMLLATGMPKYVPIPGLSSGHAARNRIFNVIEEWETAMDKYTKGEDPGSKWSNLDDVSDMLKARIPIYQKHNVSLRGRASAELGILWAANANAHPLVFWIVARLFSDAALLDQIRTEIRPYIRIHHPKPDFPLPELPSLEHIDHDGLTDKCPLLKAAYIESLRLDVSGWSFKIMQQDLTLRSREKGETPDEFVVQKGTYCHVAHELHHTDPRAFPDPLKWDAHRHLKEDPDHPGTMKADMGTVRSYGGGGHMCKGRQFALKEIMLFTAAILTFWDIEPLPGKDWALPKTRQTPGTKGIQGQMRVLVKRRKLPAE